MKLGNRNYQRVNKTNPCPVCGKSDWCMISDDGYFVLCPRVDAGAMKKYKCGYLHYGTEFTKPNGIVKHSYKMSLKPLEVANFYRKLAFNYHALQPLAEALSVPVYALQQLGAGRSRTNWYFPMYNEFQELVGLKIRNIEGKKWCLKGSRIGVYIPKTYKNAGTVHICEGESDTAAMLGQGFNTVGRSSCLTGSKIFKSLLSKNDDIIVIADNDKIGQRSACELVTYLGGDNTASACFIPKEYKDVREFVNSGKFDKAIFKGVK